MTLLAIRGIDSGIIAEINSFMIAFDYYDA